MQLNLGRRGDYAVRSVLAVARRWGDGRVKAGDIAREMSIPQLYLPQIMAVLVREGVLEASAGRDGGYTLAVPPEELTLLRVVEVAEGPTELRACVLRGGPCDWQNACPVHEHWSAAQQAFRERLGQTTFATLARADEEIESGRVTPEPAHPEARPRSGRRPGA